MTLTNLERELLSCVEELGKNVNDCMRRLSEQENMLVQLRKDLGASLCDLESSLRNASEMPSDRTQKPVRGFMMKRG